MKQIIVDLNIPADEWLKAYSIPNNVVKTTDRNGLRIQFPANILRKYTTRNGIQGAFQIGFDDEGRFQSIVKL